MTWYKLIALEEIETWLGTIKKGDEMNCIETNCKKDAEKWANKQYGPSGEDIQYEIVEVKE